jgi:hypothetical protein
MPTPPQTGERQMEQTRTSDQRAESLGEVDEARFRPASQEVRTEIDQLLQRLFTGKIPEK